MLIDGLHLRIFVPRRWVSRIAAKKTGFTFSGNIGDPDGLPTTCLPRMTLTVVQHKHPPFPFLSLIASLLHLPWTCRQHRESFASCTPTVRKLNERLQLCSRRCNEQSCLFYKFIIGVALRRITELPPPPSLLLSIFARHPVHTTLLLFYFFPNFLNDASLFAHLFLFPNK